LRKQRHLVLLGLIGLLLFASVNPAVATEVWSDNFDDGNYDGWTKHDPYTPSLNFDYDVRDGAVYANCTYTGVCEWEWLTHPSTVTEGHWSFDFYQPEDNHGPADFIVMANGTAYDMMGYGIHIATDDVAMPMIVIRGYYDSFTTGYLNLDIYTHDSMINGTWTHFDVTCDSSGDMNVFMDDEHILNCSEISYDNSEIFIFSVGQLINGNWDGLGMDNVVVDDDPNWEPETTTTTTTPTSTDSTTPTTTGGDMTTIFIIAGGGIAVVVVLVVIVKMRGS